MDMDEFGGVNLAAMMRALRRAGEEMPASAFLCACSDEELQWIAARSVRSQYQQRARSCLSCRHGDGPGCEHALPKNPR